MSFLPTSSIKKVLFSNKIKKGLGWLYNLQHESGGWPAIKPGDTMGCWATAEILYAICFIKKDIRLDKIEKGVKFLIKKQIPNKGWPLIGLPPSSTLTTSDAIMALLEALPLIKDKKLHHDANKSLRSAVNWMKKHQNNDGGWGVEPEGEGDGKCSRVIATFNATRALYALGEDYTTSKHVKRAVKFIEKSRHSERGWGATKKSVPDASNTSYALLVLLGSKKYNKNSKIIQEGIDWLKNNSTVELLWEMFGEDVVLPSGKITLHYNTTVNVLWVLLSAQYFGPETIYAINWLANEQEKEGNWELKIISTGKKLNISTYITTDAILTLFMAERYFLQNVKELYETTTNVIKASDIHSESFKKDFDKLKEKISIGKDNTLILKSLPYNWYISKNFGYFILIIWIMIISIFSIITIMCYTNKSITDNIFQILILFYSYLIVIPTLYLARCGLIKKIKELSVEQFIVLLFVIILGMPGVLYFVT